MSKTIAQDHKTDRGVRHLALDVADRAPSTVLAVLDDARVEFRTAVDHAIELAEKLAAGSFRFARKLAGRVDDASTAALKNVERRIASAVKQARENERANENERGKNDQREIAPAKATA